MTRPQSKWPIFARNEAPKVSPFQPFASKIKVCPRFEKPSNREKSMQLMNFNGHLLTVPVCFDLFYPGTLNGISGHRSFCLGHNTRAFESECWPRRFRPNQPLDEGHFLDCFGSARLGRLRLFVQITPTHWTGD
jgi:hypothetical protein